MRIVVALGGNALGIDPKEQKENVRKVSPYLAKIIKQGNEVVITHGNGPQVGLINMAFSEGHKHNKNVYEMAFSECGAMSQSYIGYHLVEALTNDLRKLDEEANVVSILTNVLVDKNDPAFENPTKPIGPFYTKEEALLLPYPVKEDSGRGYRRVIASPKPVRIIEEKQINSLLNNHYTVICCGGGGIPVIENDGKIQGIDAVIDKDFASSKLASDINADILLILTQVKNAKINFGKENEQDLGIISLNDACKYLENDEFKAGSMKPKVEACINFVKDKNKLAIITDIENALDALEFKAGTIIKY